MGKVHVTNKLPAFIKRTEAAGAAAISRCLVLGASEAARFTPRDTSTLINSQFRNIRKDGERIVGTVGYSASYALPVHEASGKLRGQPRAKVDGRSQGNFWDPSGQPEFLKKGFEQAEPSIRAAITGALKV